MEIVRLNNYYLGARKAPLGLYPFDLGLAAGRCWLLESDRGDDARTLLRVLATLIAPLKGRYRFNGERVDFGDYRHLLSTKKKIGYIAQDTAMISNRSLRENLLLMRFYFENRLDLELDDFSQKLCRQFGLSGRLRHRAAELGPLDQLAAVTVRELAKRPQLILVERPEDYLGRQQLSVLQVHLRQYAAAGSCAVIYSHDRRLSDALAHGRIRIAEGRLTAETMM